MHLGAVDHDPGLLGHVPLAIQAAQPQQGATTAIRDRDLQPHLTQLGHPGGDAMPGAHVGHLHADLSGPGGEDLQPGGLSQQLQPQLTKMRPLLALAWGEGDVGANKGVPGEVRPAWPHYRGLTRVARRLANARGGAVALGEPGGHVAILADDAGRSVGPLFPLLIGRLQLDTVAGMDHLVACPAELGLAQVGRLAGLVGHRLRVRQGAQLDVRGRDDEA